MIEDEVSVRDDDNLRTTYKQKCTTKPCDVTTLPLRKVFIES